MCRKPTSPGFITWRLVMNSMLVPVRSARFNSIRYVLSCGCAVEAKTQANKRPKKYFMPFSLPLAHLPNWYPVPVEIRSNVGAAMAASLTDEARLYVGQPHIIGPRIRVHGDAVAA